MATDEKHPDAGGQPGGTGTDAQKPKEFVDRDDDQSPLRVDSDYEPDFPGEPGSGNDAPDPGYIAFSHELGDPLADWPTPGTDPQNPPPRRRSDDVDADGWLHRGDDSGQISTGAPEADDDRDHGRSSRQDELVRFDDEVTGAAAPVAGDTLFSDGDEPAGTASADSVDRDSTTGPGTGDTPFTTRSPDPGPVPGRSADAGSSAPSIPQPRPESIPERAMAPADTSGLMQPGDDIPIPPDEHEELAELDDDADDFDDEFVDDFLNDLDAPEDPPEDELNDEPFGDTGSKQDVFTAAPADAMASMATGAMDTGATVRARQTDKEPSVTVQRESAETERSLPAGMIAVVLIALALLAVGGYGVIQQRSELQAEIRDLQSRLATAPSAEEAEAERERQRQLALENESLGAEIEALSAENSALTAQLASLEDQLAQRAAEAEAAEAAEAEARRAAEAAAQQAAAARTATPATQPAAPGGPWFVNFGSYAQRDVADRWAGKLKVDNGRVVVQTATAAGKTLYRVRVVGLTSQDAAERVATALEREYRLPRLWVGRN